jgi:hypothetical protein
MIFRIFRVFSQDQLIPTLRTVSTVLIGSAAQKPNFGSPSHKSLNYSSALPQRVLSWDPMTEAEFSNIFGADFKNFVADILIKIVESRLSERRSLANRKAEIAAKAASDNNQDFIKRYFPECATNGPLSCEIIEFSFSQFRSISTTILLTFNFP